MCGGGAAGNHCTQRNMNVARESTRAAGGVVAVIVPEIVSKNN